MEKKILNIREEDRKTFDDFDKSIVKYFKEEWGINIRLLTDPIELRDELKNFSTIANNIVANRLEAVFNGEMFFYKADKEFSYRDTRDCKSTVFGFNFIDRNSTIIIKQDLENPSVPYVSWWHKYDNDNGVKFSSQGHDWADVIKEKIYNSAKKFIKENPEWFKNKKGKMLNNNFYIENFPETLKNIRDLDYLEDCSLNSKYKFVNSRSDLIKSEENLRYVLDSLSISSPLKFINENKELCEKIKDTSFISDCKTNDYLSSIIQNLKSSVSEPEKNLRNIALGVYYDDKSISDKLPKGLRNEYKKDFINVEIAKRFPNVDELTENIDKLKEQNLKVVNMVSSYISSELRQEKLPTDKRVNYEVNLDEIRKFYKEKTGKDTDEMILNISINKAKDEIERFGK